MFRFSMALTTVGFSGKLWFATLIGSNVPNTVIANIRIAPTCSFLQFAYVTTHKSLLCTIRRTWYFQTIQRETDYINLSILLLFLFWCMYDWMSWSQGCILCIQINSHYLQSHVHFESGPQLYDLPCSELADTFAVYSLKEMLTKACGILLQF